MQASRHLPKQLLLSAQDSTPGAITTGYRTQKPNRADSVSVSDVRRSTRLLGIVLGLRSTDQSEADRSGDEEIQLKSPDLQGFQDLYDRLKTQQADLPKPDRWKGSISAQSDMGGRYHLRSNQDVLCVFGCDSRHFFEKSRGLGDLKKDQYPAVFGGPQDGCR